MLAEVKAAGLVGRGGAAFPTGVKWEGAAKAPGQPKYIVCNADESEPGTFKDRVLMEEDPHRIIEGMIIAAYAVGASQGYIYVRGEYPRAFEVMSEAVDEARQAGVSAPIFSAPAWTSRSRCGWARALTFAAKKPRCWNPSKASAVFPRIKPPFPTTHGLFGKPTVINNVETFCNVPLIVERGAAEYRKMGTERSPGPKLFCVSGHVQRPGLYEVPFGITLRHLLLISRAGCMPGARFKRCCLAAPRAPLPPRNIWT